MGVLSPYHNQPNTNTPFQFLWRAAHHFVLSFHFKNHIISYRIILINKTNPLFLPPCLALPWIASLSFFCSSSNGFPWSLSHFLFFIFHFILMCVIPNLCILLSLCHMFSYVYILSPFDFLSF